MSDPGTEIARDPVGERARELCAEFCPSATDGPCPQCTAEKENHWRRDAEQALASAGPAAFSASDEDAEGQTDIRRATKPMFVVFDLDGTLALTEHRASFVSGPGRKDWRAFYGACDRDGPNHPIIATLLALDAAGMTSRSGQADPTR